jgi:MraZ protein
MFGGSSEHTLDNNSRLIIPTRFRYELGQNFIVTKGIGCLCVFTRERFRMIADEAQNKSTPLTAFLLPDMTRLYRHLFSGMMEVTTDSQNRVQLSAEHKKHAGIDKEVVLVGMGDWMEIWSPENWEKYKEDELTDEKVVSAVSMLSSAAPLLGGVEPDAGVSQTGPA